jgi:hypothetical protein
MFIYQFYVYAYLRSDGTPYYIGKGNGSRAYAKHGKTPVPKNKSRIVFLETNLSEIGALALERRYIKWYGRKDIGTGILRNLTDGGEGSCGLILSKDSRQKISMARKGKARSEETKERIGISNRGKIISEETKRKMSDSRRGRTYSDESKQKMSNASKGKPKSEEAKRNMSLSKLGKTRGPYKKKSSSQGYI